MKLVIHAHTLKNEPMSQAITAQFDERGGTIGRSDTNTLTLPDPERHVSRLQAEVLFAGQGFSIRNVGSANAIQLNGRSVGPGEGGALADGDELVIGGYALRAALESGGVQTLPGLSTRLDMRRAIGAPLGVGAPAAAPSGQVDPFADLLGAAGGSGAAASNDPFAGLMAPPRAQGAHRGAAAVQPTDPAPARLPDDFDPFADIAPAPTGPTDAAVAGFMQGHAAPGALQRSGSNSFANGLDDALGLTQPVAAPSLDAIFGLGGTGQPGADALAQFLAPASSPEGVGPTDPLAMFDRRPAEPAKLPAAFDQRADLGVAYEPPAVRALPAVPPPVAPQVEAAARPKPSNRAAVQAPARATPQATAASKPASAAQLSATPEALWQAFCEGAGISLALPQGLNPDLMRVMGQLMHHAIEGTLKLVAMRTAAKQELRAQVTTIRAANNNPLKFAADPAAALMQLLQPPMRGFMMAPEAVRDVMDDLLGHNIGTMTGTRAALQGMLHRFEPARLEAKLAGNSVIDALLPMNRRARLWELYVQHYQRIQDDAQEDFHELFGRAFVKAYEEQLERLEAARRKPG